MASDGIKGLAGDAALAPIANLVNLSADLHKMEGAKRALEWCDAFEANGISDAYLAVLNYFRANAWAALTAFRNTDKKLTLAWDQPEWLNRYFTFARLLTARLSTAYPRFTGARFSQTLAIS
jgi:hypothetical protein